MKRTRFTIFGLIVCTLISLVFVHTNSVSQKTSDDGHRSVELSIFTQKQEFRLGEPVEIGVSIKNTGQSDIRLWPYTVRSTGLDIRIADSKMNFRSYAFRPSPDDTGHRLKPDETLSSHERVFFNQKPVVDHLSEKAAKEVSDGKILTDYAFPEPGVYRIKARLFLRPGRTEYVESSSIEIHVTPVQGNDIKVWNTIKSDVRIGQFMQHGSALSLSYPDTEERLLKDIDGVVADHPASYLAGILRDKVAERRVKREQNRIERQKFDEKVKRQRTLGKIKSATLDLIRHDNLKNGRRS